MAKDSESKNPFLAGSSDYIRPNAIFNPPNYRNLGVYVLLYNEIKGSLSDYGFEEHVTLDVRIDNKIKEIIQLARKIYDNRRLGLDDSHGLDTSKPEYKHALNWMKNLLPCSKGIEKDADGNPIMIAPGKPLYSPSENQKNIDELDNFLSNYEAVKSETQRVAGIMKKEGGMLSVEDARLLLDAKRTKVRQLYEYARANQDYKPGKIDKDGSPKSGIHAAAYFEAQNELAKKKRLLRRNGFYNFLKGAASVGCAAMMVVSGGALLSYGGFALTSIFGSVFSAAGVGASALGAVGSVFGFFGMKNFYKRWRKGMKKSYDMRIEIKDFIGPAYHGKELEKFLAANWGKDGKNLTLNEKKTLFMFDRALKAYFELEGGKDNPKFPAELKMYLPDDIIKKWKLADDKKWFNYVSDKNGGFQTALNNFSHVVQRLEGKGEYDYTEILGKFNNAVKPETVLSTDKYIEILDEIDRYETKITPARAAGFRRDMAGKLQSTIFDTLFENAYTDQTKDSMEGFAANALVKKCVEGAPDGMLQERIDDSIRFMKLEGYQSTDNPLDDKIGASFEAQLSYEPSVMEKACAKFGAVDADVRTAITSIVTMTDKSSYGAANTAVTTVEGANPKMGAYLRHMLTKRNNASIYTASGIQAQLGGTNRAITISAEIAGIHRDDKGEFVTTSGRPLQTIRDSISKLGRSFRTPALNLLDEQVSAIEQKERDSSRETAMGLIKGKKITGFGKMIDQIENITLDNLESAETIKLIEKTIPASPLRDYYAVRVKEQIENLFNSKANNIINDKSESETRLKNLTDFLSDVSRSTRLDEAQKRRLLERVEIKIKDVVKNLIATKDALDFTANYNGARYGSLLNLGYADGGFKEYFDLKTANSEEVKKLVSYMFNLENTHIMIAKVEAGGVNVKETESEARAFSSIFMSKYDRNPDSDELIVSMREMQALASNASMADFPKDDPDTVKTNNFMVGMKNQLQSIKNSSMSADEKFAAIIIMKKRCVSMMKAHLNTYYRDNNITNIETYLNGPGYADVKTNIYDAWYYGTIASYDSSSYSSTDRTAVDVGILKLIDLELEYLEPRRKIKDGGYQTAKTSIDNAFKPSKASRYIRGENEQTM